MTLPLRHFLLALSVVAIWGSNFVVIRWGLNAFPPLLFAALRFTFAALPAMLLLPRPKVGWRNLAAYGAFVGVGQFALLYLAMRSQISPGLASLVIQTQVFFTLLLAMRMSGERVQGFQWLALITAAAGIGVIASNTDGTTTVLGLGMVLLAALCWSSGNIVGKRAGAVNMLGYVVWSSAFAAPALFVLSFIVEGPAQMGEALQHAGLGAWGAVLWQSVGCYRGRKSAGATWPRTAPSSASASSRCSTSRCARRSRRGWPRSSSRRRSSSPCCSP